MRLLPVLAALALWIAPALAQAQGADPAKLKAFLQVTGFDVAIASLQQGAMAGPGLVGDAPGTFGAQYTRLAEEVFQPDQMIDRAVAIMSAVMPDELVDAGAEFYASDLGQRLVAVENESHMADDTIKYETGNQIVTELMASNPARLQVFRDLNDAIGSAETGRRAIVEVQVRFLLAAIAAGAMDMSITEEELRAQLLAEAEAQEPQTQVFALLANAYTYRDLPDEDMMAYLQALQTPEMQQVYEILNAVQYQVMIERYEALGARLGELAPQSDL